jgi:hypothetical protein
MLARSADEAKQFKDAGALILAYKSDVELLYEGFSAVSKFKT